MVASCLPHMNACIEEVIWRKLSILSSSVVFSWSPVAGLQPVAQTHLALQWTTTSHSLQPIPLLSTIARRPLKLSPSPEAIDISIIISHCVIHFRLSLRSLPHTLPKGRLTPCCTERSPDMGTRWQAERLDVFASICQGWHLTNTPHSSA